MPSFIKQPEEQPYVRVAKIVEEKTGRGRKAVTNYSLHFEGSNTYEKVKMVFRKLIEKIDDKDFVSLDEIKYVWDPNGPHSVIFGIPHNNNVYYFYILKEEIPKIETDEPIHIVCQAEEFPKSKEEFLDIVKRFM